MIINAAISSNKIQILSEKYLELIEKGIDASNILVMVQTSIQKNRFLKEIYSKCTVEALESPKIYTFNSLIYNAISDNWAYIENNLKDNGVILPNLNGLEITQYILKNIIKDIKFKGYNSKKSLLHQIFRRYSLIVQNNLSDDEIAWRSEKILKEGFSKDAEAAIHKLLSKTLQMRSLDYLRQSLIFNHIYKHTDYFKNIKYLIMDNADEMTPLCYDFVEHISKNLEDFCISGDKSGSSRSGYLSADKNIISKLEKIFNTKSKDIKTGSKLSMDSQVLFYNILNNKSDKLDNFSYLSPSKRSTMIDLATKQVSELIKHGVKPCEIAIITPTIDDMLKYRLKENFPKCQTNLIYLSGSEKLIQNSLVISAINILKLTSSMKNSLTEYDIRAVLSNLLEIPVKYSKNILEEFTSTKNLIEYKFECEEYNEKYSKFLTILKDLEKANLGLSDKLFIIYENFINLGTKSKKEIEKFTFCIKQIQDFENVFTKDKIIEKTEEIITQLENSIISENPYGALVIDDNDLIISTPQKIIDNEIETKYQIWLDISSSEWVKNDTGPLYNAWVFQKDWDKENYTVDDEIELSRQKNARILRKLVLCANEQIYAYSSLFDSLGVENFGGIEKFINFEKKTNPNAWRITPRDDQKAILDYKNGKMAISAVPGAGKTTILLALIIKLLEDSASPENIFVLTYMESAARNFRERIKNVCQDLNTLPNISTIHGLALKILKDNANFERLNLNSDFEICDDSKRYNIIQQISKQLNLKKKETEDFDKAVSVLKHSQGNIQQEFSEKTLKKFIEFYNEYQNQLQEENMIDYDDMLLFSVKLLEENDDILKYYQNICKYVIEDEAQDSSAIQQKLINLLSQKNGNLIRCGDINQSITTTFSNADVEGFRKFIKENNSVEMNCSQRCAKDIYSLANDLIEFASKKPSLANSFYNIKMNPVLGKNPEEKNSITSVIFKNQEFERNYILKEIRKILSESPDSTIGILLRNNYQVADWLKLIDESGFKTISRSESLEQKTVFKAIYAILKIIEKPFDNNTVADNYEILASLGIYKARLHNELRNFKKPFIEENVDNIENTELSRFYWDMTYWLSFATLPIEELAVKIGNHYFTSEIERSNIYLISILIKRLSSSSNDYSQVLQKVGELAKKSNLSNFKFFSETDESDSNYIKGKIQIMTCHKSKGDEFDYTFIPELTEKVLNLDIEKMELKKSSDFIEQVRKLSPNYKEKSIDEIKQTILEENLRVLYVAITRAKRKLYITCARTKRQYNKEVTQEENTIFTELLNPTEVIE